VDLRVAFVRDAMLPLHPEEKNPHPRIGAALIIGLLNYLTFEGGSAMIEALDARRTEGHSRRPEVGHHHHAHGMGRKEAHDFLQQFVLEQMRVPDIPHYPMNDLRK
jgi:hypothetical protein